MWNELAIIVIVCAILTCVFHTERKHALIIHNYMLSTKARPDSSLFDESDLRSLRNAVPEGCSLVMAESSIPESGWGVFSLEPLNIGETLPISSTADIVIHLTDPNPLTANGMKKIIWEYLWDGQEVGGQYEGHKVMSVAPGIGTLSNGEPRMFNVVHGKPQKASAGIDRTTSPSAGAISYYQNLTWKVQKNLKAGSEIFVNYGEGWFKERGYSGQSLATGQRSVEWLRQNGYCLDNLVLGKSNLEHAGRGAFANRNFAAGNIIAPVPVLPLSSDSLTMVKEHESTGRVVITEQLLRNYCFGHQNSSLLLYPYSSMINLINHSSKGKANVKLQWSEGSQEIFEKSIPDLQGATSRLLLELVATRSIQAGEEILLDYGESWQQAWDKHVQNWSAQSTKSLHPSSQEANEDKIHTILRTAAEQQMNPYPDNLFTSCYYRLNDVNPSNEGQVIRWLETPRLTEESRNLRPCMVMDRHLSALGEFMYTVRMFNRPGLEPSEKIPTGRPYIVTGVPRYAIEFSDKLYTTDQHLENAFRKEMGLDVFPRQWMDLA